MSDEQLTTVMDAALRAETWHRSPQPSRPGTHLTQEFQALRDAVGPALETTRPDVVGALVAAGGTATCAHPHSLTAPGSVVATPSSVDR